MNRDNKSPTEFRVEKPSLYAGLINALHLLNVIAINIHILDIVISLFSVISQFLAQH